jgi:hypothetical protein
MGADKEPGVFFVAGTIAAQQFTGAYPVNLYSVGPGQRLASVRQIFDSKQGLRDVADDLHGRLYLATDQRIDVVHEDEPELRDEISLESFDDSICWGAIYNAQQPPMVQYCDANKVVQVAGTRVTPRVGPGSWAMFKNLQYGGVIGGPFPMNIPVGRVEGGNIVLPDFEPARVVLTDLPPSINAKTLDGRRVWLIASSERYFIFVVQPDVFVQLQGITTENPGHASPLVVQVRDIAAGKWRTLELATTMTGFINPPVRMVEPWLVTMVTEWHPGPDHSPGQDHERNKSNDFFPDVLDGYTAQFANLDVPGKFLLDNLADGRKVELHTGQEDSEVLAIRADGELLYRANDSIYSARISGNRISTPVLLVKDLDVPEIHWAFWRPDARPATAQ